jgi:hypothetical protein
MAIKISNYFSVLALNHGIEVEHPNERHKVQ